MTFHTSIKIIVLDPLYGVTVDQLDRNEILIPNKCCLFQANNSYCLYIIKGSLHNMLTNAQRSMNKNKFIKAQ